MPTKHEPLRTCIAYKTKHPKRDLLRLVLMQSGEIAVDLKGKLSGRGANITPSLEAFDLAIKKRAIEFALKLKQPLKLEEQDELRQKFLQAIEEKNFRPDNKPVTVRIKREDLPKSH